MTPARRGGVRIGGGVLEQPETQLRQGDSALTEAAAEDYVHGICFKTGPPRRTGAELEWLVRDVVDPALPVAPHRLDAALTDLGLPHPGQGGRPVLPNGSALTLEPGGQLELSSRPADSLAGCIDDLSGDLATVRAALGAHGLCLAGYGYDPWRLPRRVLDLPRYAAMEEFFDRSGPQGRAMMCNTASVQVCVDAGTGTPGPVAAEDRWRLAHQLGPVLVAAFASSPLADGRPTGWRSTRQAVWSELDADRTTSPPHTGLPGQAWAAYALDAQVMCVRNTDGRPWSAPAGLTFRRWIGGLGERPPTLEDLAYHLTTLFPPVRPHGHLELRMIDAQPGEGGWMVPVAVVTALFDDPAAARAATLATAPLLAAGAGAPRNPVWTRAARDALTDPTLRAAAEACFAVAAEALPRIGAPAGVRAAVADFAGRYVTRGRCPADDLLDAADRR
ncbi:MAG: ergothioneine biosynthesis glutamate--cysteine ligase EgtA [Mycobacteriales bacterium]